MLVCVDCGSGEMAKKRRRETRQRGERRRSPRPEAKRPSDEEAGEAGRGAPGRMRARAHGERAGAAACSLKVWRVGAMQADDLAAARVGMGDHEARGPQRVRDQETRARRRRSRRQNARESDVARKENRMRARIAMGRRAFAKKKAGVGCPGWSDANDRSRA